MTNERPATATGRHRQDDAAMDHVQREAVSAQGADLDPDVRRFIRDIAASFAQHPQFERAPIAQQRRWAEEARAPWMQGGPVMQETLNLEAPTRHGGVRIRIHRPAQGELPGLVYLHGGGWTLFSINTHDRVMREYAARAGCCVIGVDYALSPEHKFPVAREQVVDVVAWLAKERGRLGVDPGRLAIGGDSAGANMSVATCLARRDSRTAPPLRAMVLNYGAFTTQISAEACRRFDGPEYMLGCGEMAGYWRNYLRGADDARNPLACPLLASLAGLPPAFLAIAECDILAEQSVQMAQLLEAAGVPARRVTYRGASHSFLEAMSIAAVSKRALADASDWLKRTLG
ncbi:MAG: alpha/beta hydrolase fold domain-containing protein [Gammaproteobacteria bacterium]